MSDHEIRQQVKKAFDERHNKTPPRFDEVWSAAESRLGGERRRYATFAGIAAVLAIVVIGFISAQDPRVSDEYLIADALLNRTHWAAPSDVLLPQHEYDIYREVPSLVEPTNFDEGSLL